MLENHSIPPITFAIALQRLLPICLKFILAISSPDIGQLTGEGIMVVHESAHGRHEGGPLAALVVAGLVQGRDPEAIAPEL